MKKILFVNAPALVSSVAGGEISYFVLTEEPYFSLTTDPIPLVDGHSATMMGSIMTKATISTAIKQAKEDSRFLKFNPSLSELTDFLNDCGFPAAAVAMFDLEKSVKTKKVKTTEQVKEVLSQWFIVV
jgi:hypothetical protein